jgi:ATP-dependent DNA helicase RecQ
LALTASAGEVLRGASELRFRNEAPRQRGTRRRSAAKPAAGVVLDPAAQTLWTALRAWRLDEARRQELPPYVIFHDATLIEVARRRPASLDALADIPGIGRSKLDRYGAAVLAVAAGAG